MKLMELMSYSNDSNFIAFLDKMLLKLTKGWTEPTSHIVVA